VPPPPARSSRTVISLPRACAGSPSTEGHDLSRQPAGTALPRDAWRTQGYLPIVMLELYAENLNTVGGGQPVLTGPGIVDSSNVDQVADLASAGTR